MVEEYSKQPMWQKWLAYLIVGGLVYGAVYYFWMKPEGNYTTTPPATDVMTGTSPTAEKQMNVILGTENASGQSGAATLVEADGKVTVTIALTGYAPDGVAQPAHIHIGACPGVGAVKYPLTSIVNGASETVLDVTIDQLKAELPLAINVHKSAAEAKVYTACGVLQ